MALVISNLGCGYGSKAVVCCDTLTVQPGNVVMVTGKNGSGKSTLLKTLIGVLAPVSGIVEFDGRNIRRRPVHRICQLGIGYVMQGGYVFPSLTVRENLLLAIATREGLGPMNGIEPVFQSFPSLRTLANRQAGNLSGGQRQLLALGMVFARDPALLLLDEPTASLAPETANAVVMEVGRRCTEGRRSAIIVEQNPLLFSQISMRRFVLESMSNMSGTFNALRAMSEVENIQ